MHKWFPSTAVAMIFFITTFTRIISAAETTILTFDQPQTAGISGFRAHWDTPIPLASDGPTSIGDMGKFGKGPIALWNEDKRNGKPGALVFDAVHRSLLMRFPGAAEKIIEEINKGNVIEKVELLLPFKDTEYFPENYAAPAGMSFQGDRWVMNPPQWHAVAWVLREPWMNDAKLGPTYNASINGVRFWGKFGAQDTTSDRFPQQFGPAEVSYKNPEGRMDVTELLRGKQFGDSLAQRLRVLSDQGFLVRKLEVYDARYMSGGYEYGSQTGPRGIMIGTPRLVVTLRRATDAEKPGTLPPPVDIAKLATNKIRTSTALMPSAQQIKAYASSFKRPDWMPDWQWQRVQELNAAGGGWEYPNTPEAYAKWIDSMLAMAPRRFDGFDAAEKVQAYQLYAGTWPAPVIEHWKNYWTAWLMPDRKYEEFVHPWSNAKEMAEYYARTGDWRGNTNFYRPYSRNMGTMNFNHTAVTGALIGGSIIGSDLAMADGRYGLDHYLLRTWSWYDGSTQESIDHYYFAVTLKAQKIFADFGPTQMDRMMGRNILCKSIEELTSCFHPGLRRFISSSGRTGPAELFAVQDGLSHILHSASKKGALTDLGETKTIGGMPVYGHDAPPGTIAQQALNGPWTDEWVTNMIDEKPLPYEATMSYKMWGSFAGTPLWKRSYQGKNYGVASLDVASKNQTVNLMAQWRREDKQVTRAIELGTLTCRYGINQTNLLESTYHGLKDRNPNGSLDTHGGYTSTLQHKNKMIVLTSPLKGLDYPNYPAPEQVLSLQTTIGLYQFLNKPTWELFVDENRVEKYPVRVKAGQRITLRDGVSYIGIIPLPSTNLGRSDEVLITDQTGPEIELQGGGKTKPSLLIEQYNYKSDLNENLSKAKRNSEEVDLAYGGFVIEMGDVAEYHDFKSFQQHLKASKIDAAWAAGEKQLNVKYESGSDVMECGYKPGYPGDWNNSTPTDQCFAYRRVNGQWPYLPKGIERDTTLTQQGTTGKLEKAGATLTSEPGRMAYLQTEPISNTYVGYNPFPDPVANWSLTTPAPTSINVRADGKLALTKVVVQPSNNHITVDYAVDATNNTAEMATALVTWGFSKTPSVTLNGVPGKVINIVIAGKNAFVIPLSTDLNDAAIQAIPRRLTQ